MPTSAWAIKLDTGRENIAEKLAVFKAQPDLVVRELKDKAGKVITPASVTPADPTLIEFVKAEIQKRVEALPEQFDGVLIIASGQSDMAAGRQNFTVQIVGKRGHI